MRLLVVLTLVSEIPGKVPHTDYLKEEDEELEKGWEPFVKGVRVEVRVKEGKWLPGTVLRGYEETERVIEVICDERWHDHLDFHEGRGATVPVYMATKRYILSNIRLIG